MKYSLANYPGSFVGFVVSPTKICLQYAGTQTKLRLNGTDGSELPKDIKGVRYSTISMDGTDIEILAVGHQMSVLETMNLALLDAYKKYYRMHNKHYLNIYKKHLLEFVRELKTKTDNLYNFILTEEGRL